MDRKALDVCYLFTKLNTFCPSLQIVCHLGPTAFLATDIFHPGTVLPLYGSMGMVLPVGLGLALKSNSKIIAVEGDGGLLMNLGAAATVATISPRNMLCIILDNGGYRTTGGQPSAFSGTKGIPEILEASGFDYVMTATEENICDALTWGLQPGLRALVCKTIPLNYPFRDRLISPTDTISAFAERYGSNLDDS